MTNPMDRHADPFADEIDLREYLQMFLRRWPWIVAPMLVAAIVAASISFFVLTPAYEATALVAITPPKYLMQFSPEFRVVEQERLQSQIYGSLPELAKSDGIVQQVLDALNTSSRDDSLTLSSLKDKMSVEASHGLGLIYLRIQDTSPSLAAQIANTWADLYVTTLNRLYGNEGPESTFFAEQLILAGDDLMAAQAALVEFKARDLSELLSSQLRATNNALDTYLAQQNQIEIQLQKIDGWVEDLSAQSDDRTLSEADGLTLLFMQLDAFEAGSTADHLQFQISLDQLETGRSVADQVAILENLRSLLEARGADISSRVTEIEPELLRLQGALQEAENEQARLSQELKLAESLYESLALKAEEARIAAESQVGVASLASQAAIPESPVGPRKLINTAMGAALGFAVGLALVVLLELVQEPQPAPQRVPPDEG